MTAVAIPAGRVVLLHRTFPCCGGRSRFLVEADTYERMCRTCGTVWTVRRIVRPPSDFARRLGCSFVALEWERVPDASVASNVGSSRVGVATKSGAPAASAVSAALAPGRVHTFGRWDREQAKWVKR